VPPAIAATIGNGFTVTVTLPEPGTVQPLASVTNPAKIKVVVTAGLTEIALPEI
jgi:hypothetical protein